MANPTAPIDPLVARVLDAPRSRSSSTSSTDLDALLTDPSDPISAAYRAARLDQLSTELSKATALKASTLGVVSTFRDEKALMDTVAAAKLAVVHFSKAEFARCGIMDGHLERLAEVHYEVRFLKIDVVDAPFLCEKLAVRVLPCVLGFVDGVVAERVIGFEGLGGGETGFKTGMLEKRLVGSGVLVREKIGDGGLEKRRKKEEQERKKEEDDDDDDDWD